MFGVQLKKKEKEVIAKQVKTVKDKQAKLLVLGGIGLVVLLALFGTVRALVTWNGLEYLNKEVVSVQEQLHVNQEEQKKFFDTYSLNAYVQDFLTVYLNVSDKSEEQSKRIEQLKTYVAKNVTIPSDEYSGTSRTLVSFQLVSQSKIKGYYSLIYKVKYKLSGKKFEDTKVEKDGKEVTERKEVTVDKEIINFVTVDVMEQEGKYTVLGLPYFISTRDVKGSFDGLNEPTSSVGEISKTTETELTQFLELFFTKYASGSKADLEYLMEQPTGLYGLFTYEKIKSVQFFDKGDNHYQIRVRVTFKDRDTDFVHEEYFNLTVVKENKNYKVTELKHLNDGGKKNE